MSDQPDERAVMPSDSEDARATRSRHGSLHPSSTGAPVDAGAQHPAENTAEQTTALELLTHVQRQQLDALKAAILSHVPQEHHGKGAWDTITNLAALAKAHAQDSELLDRMEDGGSRRELQARLDALIAALRDWLNRSQWNPDDECNLCHADRVDDGEHDGSCAFGKFAAVLARYGGKE